MRKRFAEHGLENFDDHTALELLLFYALPRSDTNPVAHALVDHFGSLSAIFDAPAEELCRVPGIGKNSATLIKLIPQLSRRYQMSKSSVEGIVVSSHKAGEYLTPRFFGECDEVVYMLCLDAKCKILTCKFMGRGSVNSANVSIRKIVEMALLYNATSVVLSHNHTSGIALPSKEDELTTRRVEAALGAVGIALIDHIIVADDDFVSMADNGFFNTR